MLKTKAQQQSQQKRENAVIRMMRGASPESLAAEDVAPLRTLKTWYRDDTVEGWLTCRQICELLLTGLFHATDLAGLSGIIADNEILPCGQLPSTRTPLNDPPIAAYLKAVALFDLNREGPHMACCRNCGTMSVIAYHKPAVLMRLNRAALPQAIVEPSEQLYNECRYPYRHRVPNVEVWHPGPIPWNAVEGVWTWGMQSNGQEALAEWTPQLSNSQAYWK